MCVKREKFKKKGGGGRKEGKKGAGGGGGGGGGGGVGPSAARFRLSGEEFTTPLKTESSELELFCQPPYQFIACVL